MKKNYYISGVLSILFFLLHSSLNAQCTATTVPYFENFSGVNVNNLFPTCWVASNPSITCLTLPTPSNCAAFYLNPTGQKYFYSRGVQLQSGISYSANIFFKTDVFNIGNWTDLSLLVGPNQSSTGLVSIASIAPAMSSTFKALGGLFTVPSSGVYFISIRGTSIMGGTQYLYWDSLTVTKPCDYGSVNSPTLLLTASANTLCAGKPTTLIASGANSYSWSTGALTSSIVVTPSFDTLFTVLGTNTLSGCAATMSQGIKVLSNPNVAISASNYTVCAGGPLILTAIGATWYSWSSGHQGSKIIVYPTSSTIYTVTGTKYNLCYKSVTVGITVVPMPLPTLTIDPSADTICLGDELRLDATGAQSYTWAYGPGLISYGTPLKVAPPYSATFTLQGQGSNACVNYKILFIQVFYCTKLKEVFGSQTPVVFPNPTQGIISIENAGDCTVSIYDTRGCELLRTELQFGIRTLDLHDLAKGMYFLKIQSDDKIEVLKIVKE